VLRWLKYSLKKNENSRFRCVGLHNYGQFFGQFGDKQKLPYLYKTTSKEYEFFRKSCATAVAMATMTFQRWRIFWL
jgi:hypothetical protein